MKECKVRKQLHVLKTTGCCRYQRFAHPLLAPGCSPALSTAMPQALLHRHSSHRNLLEVQLPNQDSLSCCGGWRQRIKAED
jgi:hypothetical protein